MHSFSACCLDVGHRPWFKLLKLVRRKTINFWSERSRLVSEKTNKSFCCDIQLFNLICLFIYLSKWFSNSLKSRPQIAKVVKCEVLMRLGSLFSPGLAVLKQKNGFFVLFCSNISIGRWNLLNTCREISNKTFFWRQKVFGRSVFHQKKKKTPHPKVSNIVTGVRWHFVAEIRRGRWFWSNRLSELCWYKWFLGSLSPRSPNLTGMGSNPDEEGSVCDHLAF